MGAVGSGGFVRVSDLNSDQSIFLFSSFAHIHAHPRKPIHHNMAPRKENSKGTYFYRINYNPTLFSIRCPHSLIDSFPHFFDESCETLRKLICSLEMSNLVVTAANERKASATNEKNAKKQKEVEATESAEWSKGSKVNKKEAEEQKRVWFFELTCLC